MKLSLCLLSLGALRITKRASVVVAVNASASGAFAVSGNGSARAVQRQHQQQAKAFGLNVSSLEGMTIDSDYPGTAVQRMLNVRARVAELASNDLSGRWEDVRKKLLWAGGLRDLPEAIPGQGYTGHSFNDYNHVDLTCMIDNVSDNENDGKVRGIAMGNRLGNGIRIASLPELGPGGSWTTCANGCNKDPPSDVAHVQFQARIAFKLVWVPNKDFDAFCLVDDDGKLLALGKPSVSAGLPSLRERQRNYGLVAGSKYAQEADKIAANQNVAAE